jgi:hypothetical protein
VVVSADAGVQSRPLKHLGAVRVVQLKPNWKTPLGYAPGGVKSMTIKL